MITEYMAAARTGAVLAGLGVWAMRGGRCRSAWRPGRSTPVNACRHDKAQFFATPKC